MSEIVSGNTKKSKQAAINLLSEIKKEALSKPWTPEASEIVDIIDNGVGHAEA